MKKMDNIGFQVLQILPKVVSKKLVVIFSLNNISAPSRRDTGMVESLNLYSFVAIAVKPVGIIYLSFCRKAREYKNLMT